MRRGNDRMQRRQGYTVASFGPREVNLDYYPSWIGRDHVLVMRAEDALPLRLAVPRESPRAPEH